MLDSHKFSFILCVNNDLYQKECIHYIRELTVPSGYEIDILCITDATSMTSAYNAAMQASDAKYKIYLHQDVFLLAHDFLSDILTIFQNPSIGMIGTVGALLLPQNAQAASHWDCGDTLCCTDIDTSHICTFRADSPSVTDVTAIDGMLMITQYDFPWDETTFDAFHFYDISQCMTFRSHGYRIVVPKTDAPWAIHDSGISSEKGYDIYRKRFCSKYQSQGFHYDSKDDTWYTLVAAKQADAKTILLRELSTADITAPATLSYFKQKLDEFSSLGYLDKEMLLLRIYIECIQAELDALYHSNIAVCIPWSDFPAYYTELKFLLWHIEFEACHTSAQTLLSYLQNGVISVPALQILMKHCSFNAKAVSNSLQDILS